MADLSFDLMSLLISTASAAEPAASPGMPQLNPKTIATQIFWTLVTFGALYVVMSRMALPKLAKVLAARSERIDGDLAAGQAAKEEADRTAANYVSTLERARSEAAATMRATVESVNKDIVKREMEAARKAATEAKAVEARIAAAQRAAMVNVSVIATEVAAAAVERLSGAAVAESEVAGAVGRVLERRG